MGCRAVEIVFGVLALGGLIGGVLYLRRSLPSRLGWQEKAGLALTGYAERLRAAAEEIDQPHADVFWDMAQHLERIRMEVLEDARDLVHARRFISYHARVVVELIEKFVSLNSKARAEHKERIEAMGTQLHSYRDVFARVEKACIDHDFDDMEAAISALDTQLERLAI